MPIRTPKRTPRPCACGAIYDEFRTGETFASVRRLMRDDPHPETGAWRQKRRSGVLGYWRELKIRMFEFNHGNCDEAYSSSECGAAIAA